MKVMYLVGLLCLVIFTSGQNKIEITSDFPVENIVGHA